MPVVVSEECGRKAAYSGRRANSAPALDILSRDDSSARYSRATVKSNTLLVVPIVGSRKRFIFETSVVTAILMTVEPNAGNVIVGGPAIEKLTPGASLIVSMDKSTTCSRFVWLTIRTVCGNTPDSVGSRSNVTAVTPSTSLLNAVILPV